MAGGCMEFHIISSARDKYAFDEQLFAFDGNFVFVNFQAVRNFTQKLNDLRENPDDPSSYIQPAQINALGLLDEISHIIFKRYYEKHGKDLQSALFDALEIELGSQRLKKTLLSYGELFPALEVYRGKIATIDYYRDETKGTPNAYLILEELILTWLLNQNPAAKPYQELFTDHFLIKNTDYSQLIFLVTEFFKEQPPFGADNLDLITFLRQPAILFPNSLNDQLEYISKHWTEFIGERLSKLLSAIDHIAEESKAFFIHVPFRDEYAPTYLPDYSASFWADQKRAGDLENAENYSPDSDWMPKVVMIAKNSFVWLSQLSKQYQRNIQYLSDIPNETLDELAEWGFTALWLIGLWERSNASQTIKKLCGNPDAVASAYSLDRYDIAQALGGYNAYKNLADRCAQRGIRLASDMVPNHMGIDSDWVHDHPDWFIHLEHPPFPVYSFDGPELSSDPKVSIKLEDHYYSRTDAAVVFKHYDHRNGQTRYIYHGNDGTSMPWNDTAQLNYLNPEVREAVIQTILHVARQFPIIRFDAAMTLTKKHFQRLWFPQPGTGGDIPSRAEHAMSKEDFDKAMPEEFWREVVDRVATEVPDTLLLAEAFWLMEGYFVRSLGMHRVYNSAFMNMLRNEENAKYRQLIKSTLTFDPEILKRYVNFMNNPDEKTAVEQFGKGDKYFGICTLLATMPGLPMFGHGQIEGYSEKYGMEYYRPYWDEKPDQGFVDAHRHNIFPILHRRRLFAEVSNFRLYDFKINNDEIDENVFAYSNALGNSAALVIYNNHFGNAAGWIKTSAPYLVKHGNDNELHTENLAQALRLPDYQNGFLVMRDQVSRKTYLRPMSEVHEKGLFFSLNAYERMVLSDFYVLYGEQYAQLHDYLQGHGVDNLDATLEDLRLQPFLRKLDTLLHNLSNIAHAQSSNDKNALLEHAIDNWKELNKATRSIDGFQVFESNNAFEDLILYLDTLRGLLDDDTSKEKPACTQELLNLINETPFAANYLLSYGFISRLCGTVDDLNCAKQTLSLLSKEQVRTRIYEHFRTIGLPIDKIHEYFVNCRWLIAKAHSMSSENLSNSKSFFERLLINTDFRQALMINEYEGIEWFNQEAFETMLLHLNLIPRIELLSQYQDDDTLINELSIIDELVSQFKNAEKASSYRVDKFLDTLP